MMSAWISVGDEREWRVMGFPHAQLSAGGMLSKYTTEGRQGMWGMGCGRAVRLAHGDGEEAPPWPQIEPCASVTCHPNDSDTSVNAGQGRIGGTV
jgi:hypothetical protein